MNYLEDDEMTDLEIKLRYGPLVAAASAAFAVDPSYATDIAKKAKMIQARGTKKNS